MNLLTIHLLALIIGVIIFSSITSVEGNQISLDGYPLEIHHVTTEDGYILELHRIPRGRNEIQQNGLQKKVVFWGTCLFCSSSTFVNLGPTRALAYMVANAGYDVWLMNARGTKYSERHVSLSSNSDDFWKFSWHENGYYDLPASIDYVLNITGEAQLDYVGYSMGSTMFFVLMSERPGYNKKVRSMICMAPPVYVNGSFGTLPRLTQHTIPVSKVFANIRRLDFPIPEMRISETFSTFCDQRNEIIFGKFCNLFLDSFNAGGSNVDKRMLPFFFKTFPGKTSVRTIIHFAQLKNAGKFQKYSFGRKMNKLKYGTLVPPIYNLSMVTVPVSMFYGDGDIFVTTPVDLILADGFPVEIHHVTTEDGYILELHRIPRGKNEIYPSFNNRKRVVFFPSCLYCSSAAFLALGPEGSIGYMVANAGYDVWFMNARGAVYSQNHTTLSSKSEDFWKFSFHEHGIYDLPASIDYILKTTGETQLDYIAYSMGGTMFFILMSERPEYAAKIRKMIAIAPAVYLNSSTGLVPSASPLTNTVAKIFANIGVLNLSPQDVGLNSIFAMICDPAKILLESVCTEILNGYGGSKLVDRRILETIFKHFPGPTSLRTVIHYAQYRNSAKFEKYNFGQKLNSIKYGSYEPPTYDLSKVTTPIYIFYGALDDWVPSNDVERLMAELPSLVFSKKIPTYAHLDFAWALSASSLVYNDILNILSSSVPYY